MKFEFYCGQCGKNKEVILKRESTDPALTVRQIIESQGWIVQLNYPYLDVYCSKRCAE
jgi:hypothetical protein